MSEAYRLQKLTSQDVIAAWPAVQVDLMQNHSLWGATQTIESIGSQLLNGMIQLWAVVDPANIIRMTVFTRLSQYPTGVALEVMWGHGFDARNCVETYQVLEDYARTLGCMRVEINGRKGWERVLKPLGYRVESVTVTKDLTVVNGVH